MSLKIILLFLWLFSVKLNFFGYIINISLIITLLLILVNNSYYKYQTNFIIMLLIVCLICGCLLFLNNSYSNYLVNSFIYSFIVSLGFFSIIKIYNNDKLLLLKHIVFCCMFNSLIILLSALNENFTSWIYNFIVVTDKQYRYMFGEVLFRRYSGLAESGFSFLSTINYFSLIISIYLIKYCNLNKIIYGSFLLIIVISNIWIGRTGFFLSLVTILILFSLRVNVYSIVIFFIMSYLIIKNITFIQENFFYITDIISGDSVFFDLMLSEYIFLYNSTSDFLFGSTINNYSANSLASDVGIVNLFNYFGLFGMILYFSIYFYPLNYTSSKRSLSLVFIFSCVVLLLNLKDSYLINNSPTFKFLLILTFVLFDEKKYSPNNSNI